MTDAITRRTRRARVAAGIRGAAVVPADAARRVASWRRRQRELLAESNRIPTPVWVEPTDESGAVLDPGSAIEAPGRTLTVRSPFGLGFGVALGALTAWLLVENLTRLSTVLTYFIAATFVTLALNPVVEWLTRRRLGRGQALLVVCLGILTLAALVGLLVIPPIVSQSTALVNNAPDYLRDLGDRPWFHELDVRYQISEKLSVEAEKLITDQNMWSRLFGGVLGAAGWVAASVIGVVFSLILSIYLLATLPDVKDALYHLVPRSRRPRVQVLAEEIMRRVGGYALGQGAVAAINGVCSWVMMTVLGIPYAVVLAVIVAFVGMIPMVGGTLAMTVVGLVALTVSPTTALIVVVYYVIYQQIENYVLVPFIMRRTVSVPGAVTVVAVLVGATLLGVVGAVIAIPVAAGLLLIYSEVLVPRQERL